MLKSLAALSLTPQVRSLTPLTPGGVWNADVLNGFTFDMACFPGIPSLIGPDMEESCRVAATTVQNRLPEVTCMDGCKDKAWLTIFYFFIISRGCIACLRSDMQDWNSILNSQMPPGCLVGQLALSLTRMIFQFYDTGTRTTWQDREDVERLAEPHAKATLELSKACADDSVLSLLGVSVGQIVYMVDQLMYNFSRPLEVDAETNKKLVLDIGMQNGMDARYYLQQGYRVVSVEMDPVYATYVEERFSQPGLTILRAKVGWAPNDVTCMDLIDRYGLPYYLKVDIDGLELACLASLRKESRLPTFISVELLTHATERGPFQEQVVQRLHALGYFDFKLVRQHVFNFLDREENGIDMWSGSGPIGEDAIDFRYGKEWRDAQSTLHDLDVLGHDLGVHREWYDLHAKWHWSVEEQARLNTR
eukprot:TRINITY_DN32507_c0_g1_i1.p1 TRINITY_DN32507_c0_g1~~TRINITY_DN32507_c0_g1_i1.p1  ORF type:complete len:419 (-),score=51.80 TRINITY_DN32507_c0_g1_i1:229-1485(-)